jgi:hypothetical protein
MKRLIILIFASAAVIAGAGCGKHPGAAVAPAALCDRDCGGTPGTPDPGGPTTYGTASEVALDATSLTTLRDFFFQNPPSNPQNLRIGMNVGDEGSGGYGGEVWVSFEDGGVTHSAVVTTTHPNGTGVSDSSNNVWFTYGGNSVWHGFFQDRFGAVVVVIDNAFGLGDGDPAAAVSGSIWYQNFGYTGAPQGPLQMCWNISLGPYDCRTFIVGGKVATTSALYPNNYGNNSNPPRQPYKKLGNFYNMPRAEAMGN